VKPDEEAQMERWSVEQKMRAASKPTARERLIVDCRQFAGGRTFALLALEAAAEDCARVAAIESLGSSRESAVAASALEFQARRIRALAEEVNKCGVCQGAWPGEPTITTSGPILDPTPDEVNMRDAEAREASAAFMRRTPFAEAREHALSVMRDTDARLAAERAAEQPADSLADELKDPAFIARYQAESALRTGIASAINMASAENASNTPDFVLAEYLTDCLDAFDKATRRRDEWYGIAPRPGMSTTRPAAEKEQADG
jgi:hypothetical protein